MLLEISPQKSLNFSKSCPKAPQGKSKVSFCSESCSKVVEKNCTVVCADCLLPLVAVTEVIMASSNINKLSMMISSTTSLDHIYQKLLSCLRKRGWCTLAWYFQALFSPPPPPRGGGGRNSVTLRKAWNSWFRTISPNQRYAGKRAANPRPWALRPKHSYVNYFCSSPELSWANGYPVSNSFLMLNKEAIN